MFVIGALVRDVLSRDRAEQYSLRLAPCQTVCLRRWVVECVKCATEFVNLNLYNQAASGESRQPLYLNFTRQCVKKCQRDTAIMSVRVLY